MIEVRVKTHLISILRHHISGAQRKGGSPFRAALSNSDLCGFYELGLSRDAIHISFSIFIREPRSVAESTSDFVVVLDLVLVVLVVLVKQLAGNGMLLQRCLPSCESTF